MHCNNINIAKPTLILSSKGVTSGFTSLTPSIFHSGLSSPLPSVYTFGDAEDGIISIGIASSGLASRYSSYGKNSNHTWSDTSTVNNLPSFQTHDIDVKETVASGTKMIISHIHT